jgi:hypothetical protein
MYRHPWYEGLSLVVLSAALGEGFTKVERRFFEILTDNQGVDRKYGFLLGITNE